MNEKIKSARFHHIALASHRYEETIEFYKALGFRQVAAWGEGEGRAVMMEIGEGGIFEIFAKGKDEPEENSRYFHLAIATEDPDGAYALAIKAGATPKIEPKDACIPSEPPINARLAFVYGLNGEELEFFHHKI